MRSIVIGALLALAAGQAAAEEHYCLGAAGINWNMGSAHRTDGSAFEFWIDMATGEWKGRNIGSRALYSFTSTVPAEALSM